jgi:hypothetical protein
MEVELKITNSLGQVIGTRSSVKLLPLNESPYEINAKEWERGIYYITVLEKQKIRTFRFIKM